MSRVWLDQVNNRCSIHLHLLTRFSPKSIFFHYNFYTPEASLNYCHTVQFWGSFLLEQPCIPELENGLLSYPLLWVNSHSEPFIPRYCRSTRLISARVDNLGCIIRGPTVPPVFSAEPYLAYIIFAYFLAQYLATHLCGLGKNFIPHSCLCWLTGATLVISRRNPTSGKYFIRMPIGLYYGHQLLGLIYPKAIIYREIYFLVLFALFSSVFFLEYHVLTI